MTHWENTMTNFAPVSGLVGGALIGLAAIILTYPLSGAPRCLAWGGALLASVPVRPSPML